MNQSQRARAAAGWLAVAFLLVSVLIIFGLGVAFGVVVS